MCSEVNSVLKFDVCTPYQQNFCVCTCLVLVPLCVYVCMCVCTTCSAFHIVGSGCKTHCTFFFTWALPSLPCPAPMYPPHPPPTVCVEVDARELWQDEDDVLGNVVFFWHTAILHCSFLPAGVLFSMWVI